ncbi:MAG TPA: ATP-binding protein [Solirubrobacteraceae bacterium]|nr:ATP-binding protein [Solirubrobacteraceae bacterium]
MRRTRSFRNAPESVPSARAFAAEVLNEEPEEVREVVALMISELASNCVRHADTEFEVTISRSGGEVRVEAMDCGSGAPSMRDAGPADPHGRGLQIIDMLSSSWGFSTLPKGGKTVWFALASQVPGEVEGALA